MNIVWTSIVVVSLAFCLFGETDVLAVITSAAGSGLELCFSLVAVYCFWCGMFEVLTQSGAVQKVADFIKPLINKLYGKMSPKASQFVALNLSANLLGVSNAATPSALKAIGEITSQENFAERENAKTDGGKGLAFGTAEKSGAVEKLRIGERSEAVERAKGADNR